MATKPDLIHSNTSPPEVLTAGKQPPAAEAAQHTVLPAPLDQLQAKTTRARTHTWPLPKNDQALIAGSQGSLPMSPQTSTTAAKPINAQTNSPKPPRMNLQVMLAQLDRDMADCPYYEVFGFEG